MSLSAGQSSQLLSFRLLLGRHGTRVWVGGPEYQTVMALLTEIEAMDPDFELVSDVREACKIAFEAPGPDIEPLDIILMGDDRTHPDATWRVMQPSMRNNPINPMISYVVQKIL